MKNLFTLLFACALTCVFVGACDNPDCDKYVTDIDSTILIRMEENIGTRNFQLNCETEREYSSGNNSIIFEKKQTPSGIDIVFKGVSETGMTNDIGPAQVHIDLGVLSEGSYELTLYNGEVTQTCRLVVTAESYLIDFTNNSTFSFIRDRLNRIPENTIWGLAGYHKEETASLVDAFLNDLVALGAVKKTFLPGDYYSFWIDENGEIAPYPEVSYGYWFERNFIYSYSGELEKIDQLLERYARNYNDDISIRLLTNTGEEFRTWLYDTE